MPIDRRNGNTAWASVLVETLARLGLQTAVVCPGSRSAPLAIALAQHPTVEAIPVLDERSAAFFALGMARRTHRAVVLVCSSGTAGANFYPAVIEAREGRVPLLVLTGDRPPELRDCNAGQTIDQQKLFGSYVNWYHELATPAVERLAYLRQTMIQAWERSHYPVPGPVHLNCPFRDPLAPMNQLDFAESLMDWDETDFFAGVHPTTGPECSRAPFLPRALVQFHRPETPHGIIIAGPAQPTDPEGYCRAIAHLAKILGYPVLAEGLSPVRNYAPLNPYLVCAYDAILRHPTRRATLRPDAVIRIGETPTSKELRGWLQETQPRQWVVDAGDRNLDPLHLRTTHLRSTVQALVSSLTPDLPAPLSPYLAQWLEAETSAQQSLSTRFHQTEDWVEAKAVWLLSRHLPARTPLFIANSLAVRYVEWFWQPNGSQVQPYFNRGANGIDGTLSTALGMVQGSGQGAKASGVLLTGDLALLHDTNGWLITPWLRGHLTIVLINNNGGGIFETLPIAQFDPPFEDFFATPQSVDFRQLCQVYGVDHVAIHSWQHFVDCLTHLPDSGVRLLEVRCDRKTNARWLHHTLNSQPSDASDVT